MGLESPTFGGMGLRHQRPILAARQAMLDPGRILVTGDADAQMKGAAAQPTEKNVSLGESFAILTSFFVKRIVEHGIRTTRTNARGAAVPSEIPPWCKTRCHLCASTVPALQSFLRSS